jgi:biopolymer transport protein ExbD
MVDLGFLLITFFIFTTTMASSKAMQITMPDDKPIKDPSRYPGYKTLTVIPADANHLYYYDGIFNNQLKETGYRSGIRSVIINKKDWLQRNYHEGDQLLVLIKPTKESSFSNLVSVLDEMLINDVGRYMVVDISEEEQRKEQEMRQ